MWLFGGSVTIVGIVLSLLFPSASTSIGLGLAATIGFISNRIYLQLAFRKIEKFKAICASSASSGPAVFVRTKTARSVSTSFSAPRGSGSALAHSRTCCTSCTKKISYGIGVVRAVLPLPFHVAVGIIMGCWVALAWKQDARRPFWTVTALTLPMLLHALVDVALLSRGLPGGPIGPTVAGVFAADLVLTAVLIAICAPQVIASVGPQRLHSGSRPVGAPAPAYRIVRIGRWLAIVALDRLLWPLHLERWCPGPTPGRWR